MKIREMSMIALLSIVLAAVSSIGASTLRDPYEILKHNFDANGGLTHIRAEKSQYIEGTIALAGLNGTLKTWTQKPDRSRTEVNLKVFKQVQGDNGVYQWVLDSNGKLQKITTFDEVTKKRREVKRLLDDYDYADPQSKVFKVALAGIQKVQNNDCYVIQITNNLTEDKYTSFIDTVTFLVDKTVTIEGEDTRETVNEDYRNINGLMVPFKITETTVNIGQTQVIELTKYESNPQIDSTVFEAPAEGAKDYRFSNGQSAENIPFHFIENHVFLPVVVSCMERSWVLDTGAGMSVISQEFADELGLKLEGDMKGKGAGGTVNVKFATLPPFQLRGIEFDGQKVAVIDMKDLNRAIGFYCAGILGFDFLSRFVTKVDYSKELLSFYDPETFKYTGSGNEVPMHVKEGVFAVDATLDSAHTGSWLFDVGASVTSLDGTYAGRQGFNGRKAVESMGRGAGATFRTKLVKCKRFDFAGFTIDNPIISFETSNIDTAVHTDEIGALGNTLFRNFVIYADYAHERLFVEKGDNFNRPYPRDNSGLQFILGDKDQTEVLFVAPGTPAATSGIQAGDIVQRVNGIEVQNLGGLNAIRSMLKDKPGTEYSFTVHRGGNEKTFRLRLAELL